MSKATTAHLPEPDISSTVEIIGEAAVYDQTRPRRTFKGDFDIGQIIKLLKSEKELPQTIDALKEEHLEQFRKLKGTDREELQKQLIRYSKKQSKSSLDTKVNSGRLWKFAKAILVRGREFSNFCEAVHVPRNRIYENISIYELFITYCPVPGQYTGNIGGEAAKLLARSSTPESVQEAIMKRLLDGEFITLEKVKEELAEVSDSPESASHDDTAIAVSEAECVEDIWSRDGIQIRTQVPKDVDEELVPLAFETAKHDFQAKLNASRRLTSEDGR